MDMSESELRIFMRIWASYHAQELLAQIMFKSEKVANTNKREN